MYGRPCACIFFVPAGCSRRPFIQESTSICNKSLVLERYLAIKGRAENGILLAATELEKRGNGGQNETANRIHTGDAVSGAVHRGSMERAQPEGRTEVKQPVAGLPIDSRAMPRLGSWTT